MLLVRFLVLGREHVGQVGQVFADQHLSVENGGQTDVVHEGDFAGVEHLDLLERLAFAIALVAAQLEDARLLLDGIRGELELGLAGEGEHQPAIDPLESGAGLGRVEVRRGRLLVLEIGVEAQGDGSPAGGARYRG